MTVCVAAGIKRRSQNTANPKSVQQKDSQYTHCQNIPDNTQDLAFPLLLNDTSFD